MEPVKAKLGNLEIYLNDVCELLAGILIYPYLPPYLSILSVLDMEYIHNV